MNSCPFNSEPTFLILFEWDLWTLITLDKEKLDYLSLEFVSLILLVFLTDFFADGFISLFLV
jgi:hypothetical protein